MRFIYKLINLIISYTKIYILLTVYYKFLAQAGQMGDYRQKSYKRLGDCLVSARHYLLNNIRKHEIVTLMVGLKIYTKICICLEGGSICNEGKHLKITFKSKGV